MTALSFDDRGTFTVQTKSSVYAVKLDGPRSHVVRMTERGAKHRGDGEQVPLVSILHCNEGHSAVFAVQHEGYEIPTVISTTPVQTIERV